MKKELIIRSNNSAVDFALLNDGKLIELNKEIENNKFSIGDIFYAKVRKGICKTFLELEVYMKSLKTRFTDIQYFT